MSWSVTAVFNGLVIFILCLSQCSAGCANLDSVSGNCATIGDCKAETGWPSDFVQCFNRSQDSHICNFPSYNNAVPTELGVKVDLNASAPIFQLPDAHLTASSNKNNAKYARIGLASDKMWCAENDDNKRWLEIDLGIEVAVTRIELEPAGQTSSTNFTISFRNTTFNPLVPYQNGKKFYSTKKTTCHYLFIVNTDLIRIDSLTSKPCFRLAVYGKPPVRMAEPKELGVKVPPQGDVNSYYRIPDGDFTASSNSQNAKYARIGLPNDKMWCAASSDNDKWLQIILDVATTVERIDVEGDINQANWEQKFSLRYKTNKDQNNFLNYRNGITYTSRKDSSSHYISIPKPYAIRIYPKNKNSNNCFRVAIYGNPIDRKDIHFEDVVQVVPVPITVQPTAKLLGQDSLSASEFLKSYLLWAIFLVVFVFLLILFLTFLFCWCCRREREFERKSNQKTTVTQTNYVPSWRTIDAKTEKGYLATREVQEVKIAFTDEYIPPDLKKEKLDPNDETHYRHKIFSFRGWETQKTPTIQVDPAPNGNAHP